MKVLVNDEQVEVTLENENTVGQVVGELRAWLRDRGLELSQLLVDNAEISPQAPGTWREQSLDGVSSIEVKAVPHPANDPEALAVLREFTSLLARNLESGTEQSIRDVLQEYGYARPALLRALGATGSLPPSVSAIDELNATLSGDTPLNLSEENSSRYTRAASAIEAELATRLLELSDPASQKSATHAALEAQLPFLIEIPSLLQQGGDAEAMRRLMQFTELAEKLVRLGGWDGSNTGELNSYLGELIQAFEAHDTVLIGDLVEYEIVPRVQQLLSHEGEVELET